MAYYYELNRLVLFVLFASTLFVALSLSPTLASADVIASQTAQILPLGSNNCAPVSATGFTPYIYDGSLHSFEFTLSDSSYVALLGSVGNTSIPFNQMTRNAAPNGGVRIHVDITTTRIMGTVPLQVTLLSARTGQPVCVSIVSMSVGTGPVATQNIPVYTPPVSAPTTPVRPSTPSSKPVATSTTPVATTSAPIASTSATGSVIGTQNPLKDLCASETSAYRLWVILLVLYALIVGAALWAEFPMSLSWARTPERIATIILVLLLLLLAFWYFSVSCRAALWMPLLAFLIAVLGLLAAFWNHPRVTQLLLIQQQTTVPTKKF